MPVPRLTIEVRDPAHVAELPETVPPPPPRPAAPVGPESLLISQRVVLHLYRLGAFDPREVAPKGATQGGMTGALGIRQSSLTKVLVRLVAAGVLEEARTHVRGEPRRLKVYRLSPLGESLARDLRRAGVGRTAPALLPPDPPGAS